jgi:hypothetical protein
MTLERFEVLLDSATLAELRRDAAARGVTPVELAREAIEAFVDVERAVVLEPEEIDEGDEFEELGGDEDDEDWLGLERELRSVTDSDY